MKRDFAVVYPENFVNDLVPGDEAAHRAARALADRADAPTIIALSDVLALLERVGGQFHVVALREEGSGDGTWNTVGLAFRFDTRDAHLTVAKAPEQVCGVPVTNSEEAATVDLDVPASEPPEEPPGDVEPPGDEADGTEPYDQGNASE